MRISDLKWLIKKFGGQAKVADVMRALRLITETGEKLRGEK